jgi:hypothetical protein
MVDFPIDVIASSKENVSNKSTNVNTDQASNTKYPSVKAVFDWATNLFFPKPTGTTAQYLRGDGSLETFPTIPDVSGLVAKADYTPAHSILAQQSGTGSPTAVQIGNNEILGRKSGGGSNIEGLSVSETKGILNYTASDVGAVATNSAITGATKTKITYDAKGLVTAGADATTADIADSTDNRYVTDANLTVIGNTSGTNTGDETQSSILSKLGWWRIHESTVGNNSSGTSNTISKSIQIGAITDILNIEKVTFKKTGNNSTFIGRIYLSEVDNNIGGTAILLATANTSTGPNTYLPITRIFEKIGSNISGINATTNFLSDISLTGQAMLNTPILTTSPLYLIFTVQCSNASDVARFESCHIKNF